MLVLAICAAGPDRAEPALSTMLAEVPDIVAHPDARDLMEAMADPLMLLQRGRLVAANPPAHAPPRAHLEGQDARIALRHPPAADPLDSQAPPPGAVPHQRVRPGARPPTPTDA